ncbi:hypothetical protein HYV86_03670 [Candidatus Woesearchaeota archaeon]|nr:hypothetical protein [Candidatus Woesearchaeota archaeon]
MVDEQVESNTTRKEFSDVRKEQSSLRTQVSTINKDKEDVFRQLRSIRDKIADRLARVNALKQERDALTTEVKNLKQERDKLNDVVKGKASQRKDIDEKKQHLMGKVDVKEDPSRLRKQIEQIESRLETDVMPFNKEQELRKVLKDLQNKVKKLGELGEVWNEVKSFSSEFSVDRKKAQESHKLVQQKAQESQERHEQLNALYEEIKKLREEEKPLVAKYVEFKKQYDESKVKLEDVSGRAGEMSKHIEKENTSRFDQQVKVKTDEVKEKMRKGKKLTTEDILAFQALKD